jgi:ribonuclease D
MTPNLPPFRMIDDADTFRWLAVELSKERLLALDTESNSLHAYKERVCLVQLSTRQQDYIIDPFAIADLSPLGVLLADPHIEIVLHAAEYDLMTLKRDYGFAINNLFDTMIAARIAQYTSFGLASVLEYHFDVKPDKSHQRDNWGKRPLSADSLLYAQMDTHYLPRLRDELHAKLVELGRWEETQEIFREAAEVPAADNTTDPEGYWNIGRPADLNRTQMAVLRELYLLREELAEAEDVAIFKVLTNNQMVNIAREIPRALRQLNDVKRVPGIVVRRYGDQIIDAVNLGRLGVDDLPPEPPLPTPPDSQIADRFTVLQQWRKEKGIERGVGSDMVLHKSVLWALAKEVPASLDELRQVDGIGPVRLKLYGEELMGVLSNFHSE